MMVMHHNPNRWQHYRCTRCGWLSCCADIRWPCCTSTSPWGHDLQPFGTGKRILAHTPRVRPS